MHFHQMKDLDQDIVVVNILKVLFKIYFFLNKTTDMARMIKTRF